MSPLLLLSLALAAQDYGVPVISSSTEAAAFEQLGYQTAQDRLWQLEMSRRTFRGQLAEVRGPASAASDAETLRTCPSDAELMAQYEHLSAAGRTAFSQYALGINRAITERKKSGSLPKEYASLGFEPRPWTIQDSAAIAVGMARRFGGGGAGEIRNLLAYSYLNSGHRSEAEVLDLVDDLLWQNDQDSIPTVDKLDIPAGKVAALFPALTREVTKSHISLLPKPTLPELMPGIRLAKMDTQAAEAQKLAVMFKTGSYAFLVHKNRSKTGANLLLSGPQMGHTKPSIVYEVRLDTPTLKVQGITVPGVPFVVVGNTPSFAWGLTTAVADTTDIFFNKDDGGKIQVAGKWEPIVSEKRSFKVKGEADREALFQRTRWGVVVAQSPTTHTVFSMRASYHGKELSGFDQILAMQRLRSVDQVLKFAPKIPLGFNLFLADKKDIGYAYCGLMPRRSPALDPRFPTPGEPQYDWRGVTPLASVIHVKNPKGGLMVNWNNKPTSEFPNLDTPAWGAIFRNEILLRALPTGAIGREDLIAAIRHGSVADDETQRRFLPYFRKWAPTGSKVALALAEVGDEDRDSQSQDQLYYTIVDRLREKVFMPKTGGFLQPSFFKLAVQNSLLLRALEGKTKTNFGTAAEIEALGQAVVSEFESRPAPAGVPLDRMPYGLGDQNPTGYNRGTFIQIVELGKSWSSWSVLGPGNTESGAHAIDQADLVRNWEFKPQHPWP